MQSAPGREPPEPEKARASTGHVERAVPAQDYVAHLFDTHYDFVWRLLRRLGVASPLLDDAAQRVFIIAARKALAIDRARERPFLHGVAIRVASDARDAARRSGGPPQQLDEQAPSSEPSPDELLDRKWARRRLDQILADMGLKERTVFVLFEIEGLTMAEIAELEQVPMGTVASRLRRARETFAHKLARMRLGKTA